MSHTPRPVMDPAFWRERIRGHKAQQHPYRALFDVLPGKWDAIEAAHRRILADHVTGTENILDVGCAYGRLLSLLPEDWQYGTGNYFGIDLSPDFIDRARELMGDGPRHTFRVHDLRAPLPAEWLPPEGKFDLAVLISVRGMVRRECGLAVWEGLEENIRAACRRMLTLEYDERDPGTLEDWSDAGTARP